MKPRSPVAKHMQRLTKLAQHRDCKAAAKRGEPCRHKNRWEQQQ